MTMRASSAKVCAIALSLGLAVSAAQAASLVEVAGKMDQLKTFNDAIAAAGLEDKLAGEGPYTVFAPSNEAFEQLPRELVSKLFEEGHQAELARLLEHHVVDGKALTAKDAIGRETEVDTLSGDALTIDGTDSVVVVVVPAGLTVARVGDQIMVERRAAVAAAPSVEVETADQAPTRTEVAEESDMPASEHQQEVLRSEVDEETRQTAPEGGMPSTEHQEQVLRSDSGEQSRQAPGQQAQRSGEVGGESQRTATTESGMPVSEHQEEALKSDPAKQPRQTAQEGGMPATPHQQEVLAGDGQQGLMRQANVVESDLEADNGVIHVIDAVLVPQELRATLEQLKGGA